MSAAETFRRGAEEADGGDRRMSDEDRREFAELLRRALELLESDDHDQRAAAMQAVHDHPEANEGERAEAAHHIAVSHAARGDHDSAAAWHAYTRQLPGATSEHHEVGEQHAQRHATAQTHEHPLHDGSSATHIQAHLDHADQHLASGNHDEAIARHSAVANHPAATGAQQAHAMSQVAQAHAARGDHAAATEWHQAAAAHPDATDAHRRAAQEHHESHGAGSHVHGGSSSDDLRRLLQRAEEQAEYGDVRALLEILLAIIEHGNADGDTQAHATHLAARAYERDGDHQNAADHHRRAAEHSSARAEHREHYDRHRTEHQDHHAANY